MNNWPVGESLEDQLTCTRWKGGRVGVVDAKAQQAHGEWMGNS